MIPFLFLDMEDEEDRAFMTDIYLKYERLIWSTIRKILKNHPGAEDAFQTCLMKLMQSVKKLQSITNERNLVSYIITAAKHAALDEVRRKTMESFDDEAWGGQALLQADDDMVDFLYQQELAEHLKSVWPLLDERSRYLLEGKYFLGLTTHEMGATLHITHNSVRVELSRARNRVKKLLRKHFSMTEL